jgi:hypothetical protein
VKKRVVIIANALLSVARSADAIWAVLAALVIAISLRYPSL